MVLLDLILAIGFTTTGTLGLVLTRRTARKA